MLSFPYQQCTLGALAYAGTLRDGITYDDFFSQVYEITVVDVNGRVEIFDVSLLTELELRCPSGVWCSIYQLPTINRILDWPCSCQIFIELAETH